MTAARALKIGFIPLVDAASLFVAADMGYAAQEGLELALAREVSWSNIRDRLAIGHYDAAHLLTPMAVASALEGRQMESPIVAAFNLAFNGNAITVSPALLDELTRAADGALADPCVSARALARIVRAREKRGDEPLTFGMTFPFSVHNYQLRYWMAEGGIDPDADVRLVALPPPFMVESIAKGEVDGFCVGAPWNAVAQDAGVGAILHLGCEIFDPAPEKTLALRQPVADAEPDVAAALVRACLKAADFVKAPENRDEVVALLARPDRVGAEPAAIRRALAGSPRGGDAQANANFLMIGDCAIGRPDQKQASWLYAQLLRWGQARYSDDQLRAAQGVFDPRFFDATLPPPLSPARDVAAFAGAGFDQDDIRGYLASFAIGAKV